MQNVGLQANVYCVLKGGKPIGLPVKYAYYTAKTSVILNARVVGTGGGKYQIEKPMSQNASQIPGIATGVSTFNSLIEKSTVFIDKTMLVREFLQNPDDVLLVTYPRRWGKTLNMSMLKTFFEIEVDENGNPLPEEERKNSTIFSSGKNGAPLEIWQHKDIVQEYHGKFPVISVSFKETSSGNFETLLNNLSERIQELFETYGYLKFSSKISDTQRNKFTRYLTNNFLDQSQIQVSLKFLSELLHRHFNQKVIILIDEYDSAINEVCLTYREESEKDNAIRLFRGVYGEALKDNIYLQKGYITGITRIAKANLLSGINNLGEYNILSERYARYYGFNQYEVKSLFEVYAVPASLQEKIKDWYNGYIVRELEIYNPWALAKCLNGFIAADRNENKTDQFLKSYWGESGNITFIDKALQIEIVKQKIQELADGSPIFFNLREQFRINDLQVLQELSSLGSNYQINNNALSLLFSYLFFAGYLTHTKDGIEYKAPNHEIRNELGNKILVYYESMYSVDFSLFKKVTDAMQIILDRGERDNLNALFEQFRVSFSDLMAAFPPFGKMSATEGSKSSIEGNEDIVHSIMNYIVLQIVTARRFGSEVHLGEGRADIAFIDDDNNKAVVIEMKFNDSPESAIKQIKAKDYTREFTGRYDVIIAGVAVDMDKNVKLACEYLPRGKKKLL